MEQVKTKAVNIVAKWCLASFYQLSIWYSLTSPA